jgi:alpha-glucosidase
MKIQLMLKGMCWIGFFLVIFSAAMLERLSAKTLDVISPDKKLVVKVDVSDELTYSLFYSGREIMPPSSISLTLDGYRILGRNARLKNIQRRSVDEKIYPPVREKRRVIVDRFNEAVLNFQGSYSLIFRAYDDGAAYRFAANFPGKVKVISEQATFRFGTGDSVYFPFQEGFETAFEKVYSYLPLNKVTAEKMGYTPVLVDVKDGPKVLITDSDLDDYPGMFLKGSEDGSASLAAIFAPYPLEEEQVRDRTLRVKKGADYIAFTDGKRAFPWRVLAVARKDGDLIESDLVYRLAGPLKLKDTSWIKPGKVAWDWWNANNLFGVDFESGLNTATYKYYIDFASKYGLEYVILDEGWSDPADLSKVNPQIDLKGLLDDAKKKNVGIILWCVWLTLERQMQEALDQFQKWGVAGIKVDFMDRDDQKVVNFYRRVAKEAAARKLTVDFHGAFKPTGLRREYPNVLTREGVMGLEHSKWSDNVTPEHDLTIPFTRMVAGPMDFTPGAMVNAAEKNFRPIFTTPMSQGTRCHQLAMYVVYESPLQMLSDSPSRYLREPEVMEFLGPVPTVWDETKVLDAKVGDYVVVARKSGDDWYLGAMTDWTPRELVVKLDFLDEGEYEAVIYADGINASKYASDYRKSLKRLTRGDSLKISMAPGGGWVARLIKK